MHLQVLAIADVNCTRRFRLEYFNIYFPNLATNSRDFQNISCVAIQDTFARQTSCEKSWFPFFLLLHTHTHLYMYIYIYIYIHSQEVSSCQFLSLFRTFSNLCLPRCSLSAFPPLGNNLFRAWNWNMYFQDSSFLQ